MMKKISAVAAAAALTAVAAAPATAQEGDASHEAKAAQCRQAVGHIMDVPSESDQAACEEFLREATPVLSADLLAAGGPPRTTEPDSRYGTEGGMNHPRSGEAGHALSEDGELSAPGASTDFAGAGNFNLFGPRRLSSISATNPLGYIDEHGLGSGRVLGKTPSGKSKTAPASVDVKVGFGPEGGAVLKQNGGNRSIMNQSGELPRSGYKRGRRRGR